MKRLNKLTAIIAAFCYLLVVVAACERDNDIVIPQARVDSVTETSVTVGDEMTFTGTNMHLITKMLFGEVEAVVDTDLSKRDRNELKVVVPLLDETKSIVLTAIYNTNKRLILTDALEVIVPPVIPTVTSALPESVMSGNVVELAGTDLNIIKAIRVGDDEVAVRSRDKQGVSFVAPEVAETKAVGVTLIYDNTIGLNQQLTVSGTMTIVPATVPVVTSQFAEEIESGETVSIEGNNLDIVTAIRLGETEIALSEKTATLLSFVAPVVEETTSFTVTLVYTNTLGANRELTLTGALVVEPATIPVPETKVLIWKDVIIGGQGTGLSFFNGTTGKIISPCELFDVQGEVDFMMNVNTSSENQFYNPANAASVLKNQMCGEAALGTGDGKDYSTFLAVNTKFRLLTTSGVQGTLATKVKAGEIEEINDELFTGISAPSSNTPKNFAVGDVLWFYNATKSKNGLIHVKEVSVAEVTTNNTIKMDIYYQK